MKFYQNFKLMAILGLAAAILVPVYAVSKSRTVSARDYILTGRRLINLIGGKGSNSISKAEKSKHAKSYRKVDLNGDGYVTYQEYVEKGKYYTKEQRYEFFIGADRNWDLVLTEDEFVKNVIIVNSGFLAFKKYDRDDNFKISIDEYLKQMRKNTKSTNLTTRIFKKLDANADEEITYSEFIIKWGYWSR